MLLPFSRLAFTSIAQASNETFRTAISSPCLNVLNILGHALSQPSTVILPLLSKSTIPLRVQGLPPLPTPTVAAQLLLETIRKWWSLPLPVPIDATQRLADKLKEMHPDKAEDMISELSESPDSIYM